VVGAGSLVTPGKSFPDGTLIMGAPARAVRAVGERELAMIVHAAEVYQRRIERYRTGLHTLAVDA
jgi:carbonic anhydrase/acetyltransferase-like protein (isoleucine patch superfamily)